MSSTFQLDGFEPIKRIGGGGFGDVWLARQTNVDREVAIKVGHAPIQDDTIKLRFNRECKALGRLSGHPNIIGVHTAGTLNDGRPYLVLEYIDGGTLWQRLKREEIPEIDLINIGMQIAGALDKAHNSGILHRDLKPENILMRSTGEAVLGDFGIARLQDGANTTSAAITASVAYAAPEVLSGTKATIASDIYGVGICLLAAIIRGVPFVEKQDESIHPIINRVLSEAPPQSRGRGISEELSATIDWTLAKNPANRPATAEELYERFREITARNRRYSDRSEYTMDMASRTATNPLQVPRAHGQPGGAMATTGLAEPSASVQLQPQPRINPSKAASQSTTFDAGRANGADQPPVNGSMGPAMAVGPESVPPTRTRSPMATFMIAYATTVIFGGILVFLLAQSLN